MIKRHELAQHFGVHVNTIDNWCKCGYLTPLKFGRRVYFRLDQVDVNRFPQSLRK
ncbi:helix-turn-helix domain-containing protein [Flavobacteriales bacterium]|nr:helix-turn-helix domain-containing protein [Flavobacteriales bacterium]